MNMQVCRTCMSREDLCPLYGEPSRCNFSTEDLYAVTGIRIEPNDGLPQCVCSSCIHLITNAIHLRELSSKVNHALKKMVAKGIPFGSFEQEIANHESEITDYKIFHSGFDAMENVDCKSGIDKNVKSKGNSNFEDSNDNNDDSNTDGNMSSDTYNNTDTKSIKKNTKNERQIESNLYLLSDTMRAKINKTISELENIYSGDKSVQSRLNIDSKKELIKNRIRDRKGQIRSAIMMASEKLSSVKLEDIYSNKSMEQFLRVKEAFRKITDCKVVVHKKINRYSNKSTVDETHRRKITERREKARQYMSLAVTPHPPNGPIQCSVCHATSKTRNGFKSHAKTHFIPEFGCPNCPKRFHTRSHLRYHEQRRHGKEKRLVCEYCTFRAVDRPTLRNHVRARHTGERPFTCAECGVTFRMRANLVQHMRSHSSHKTVQCERCPAMFRSRGELWSHRSKVHLMNYKYHCYLCPDTYKGMAAVKKHLVNVHGIPEEQHLKITCVKTMKADAHALP